MQLTQQVLARNTRKQHVVLSSDAKGSEFIEWHAAGDPSGNDLQVVPEAMLRLAAFTRLVSRGIIAIVAEESNPEIVALLDRQRTHFEERTSNTAQQALAALDPQANNDSLAVTCVGPDSRGVQNGCTEQVPVREQTKDERPPLCPQHKHLEPKFVPSEEQVGTENRVVWRMATLTPQQQQA